MVVQLDDPAAALRHQLDQPFGRQHLQRLAQRRAADLPFGGQCLLVDPLARQQFLLEHHHAQARGHAVVQRSTAQGRGDGRGKGHGVHRNFVIMVSDLGSTRG